MEAFVLLKMHGLQYHFDNLDVKRKFIIKNLHVLYIDQNSAKNMVYIPCTLSLPHDHISIFSLKTAIQLADVNKGYPVEMDLTKLCPSLKDVQASYERLKELIFIGKNWHFIIAVFLLLRVAYCKHIIFNMTAQYLVENCFSTS